MALGLLTMVGLAAALLGDGASDFASWVALGVPVVVVTMCVARPTESARTLRTSRTARTPR